MNKLTIAVALSMVVGQVFATDNQKPSPVMQQTNITSVSASSKASASASAMGIGVGFGGQGGAGGNAIASIGDMNFAFTVPTTSGPSTTFVQHDYKGVPQQVPAMGNSYISTSNGCDGASGLGFVFPGGGINFSTTALRMMCEGRLNSQAHKILGDEDRARRVMRVVDEYACTQDATWAKLAQEEGICKPSKEVNTVSSTNPTFDTK